MNRQFTALSGVAMLLIVLNHTIVMGAGVPVSYGFPAIQGGVRVVLSLLQSLGVFAVPIFLFISGAFVSYAARGEPPRLSARFLIGGLSHIWWPYLFWSLIFYAVVFLQFGQRYSLLGYGKNLLVGYPFHFVPLLLLFYALSPVLVKLGRSHSLLLIAAIGLGQLLLMTLVHAGLFPERMRVLVPPVIGRNLAIWAVYFPLGLLYGLHMRAMLPVLKKARAWLVLLTVVFFIVGVLHYSGVVDLPLAGFLPPLPFVLLLPVIDRGSIPLVNVLEAIGKRSYGLYLTHLLVLDLTLWAIGVFGIGLFNYRLALLPLLFPFAVRVPLTLMDVLTRSPVRPIYRYLMG